MKKNKKTGVEAFQALWDVPQVARRLNVSHDWVYRAAREGRLPAMRLGKHVTRFDPILIREIAKKGIQ
jgi:excisionase family DNA binding protein